MAFFWTLECLFLLKIVFFVSNCSKYRVKTRQQDDEYAHASKLEGLSVVVSIDLAPQVVMSIILAARKCSRQVERQAQFRLCRSETCGEGKSAVGSIFSRRLLNTEHQLFFITYKWWSVKCINTSIIRVWINLGFKASCGVNNFSEKNVCAFCAFVRVNIC